MCQSPSHSGVLIVCIANTGILGISVMNLKLRLIFEISCLSVASFAIIFSHSEGCLFTLLIVSFDVQKLLHLIRSHLFIFAFISNILGGGS